MLAKKNVFILHVRISLYHSFCRTHFQAAVVYCLLKQLGSCSSWLPIPKICTDNMFIFL